MRSAAYDEFRSLLSAREFDRAAQLAERESVLRRDSDPFWLTQQAIALNLAGRPADAEALAEKALAAAPHDRYALGARAEARLRQERFAEAAADFDEILRAPDAPDRAREGLVRCVAALKDWTRLLELLARWEWPPGRRLTWQVQALRGLGRTQDALAACREWLAAAKDQPAALWALADLEVECEGLDPVCARYERLARIPSRPAVYREIYASLLRRAGRDGEAAQVYAGMNAAAAAPRIQRKEAFALARARRDDEAIPVMEELLRADPKDIYLHSAYGAACKRTGQLERAWSFYGALLAQHPEEKSLYGRRRKIGALIERPGADPQRRPPGRS